MYLVWLYKVYVIINLRDQAQEDKRRIKWGKNMNKLNILSKQARKPNSKYEQKD